MRLEIHDDAAAEIQHHHAWYEARDPRVASRLAALFEATVREITRKPLQFPLMEMARNRGNIRRARLKGFPLYILYCIDHDEIKVVAVPHTSQRAGYWKARLSE